MSGQGEYTSHTAGNGILRLVRKTPSCGRRKESLGVINRGRPGRHLGIRANERHNKGSEGWDRPGPGLRKDRAAASRRA